MRIESDHSHLCIERIGQEGPTVVWRIEASVRGLGWKFAAAHDQVRADAADDTSKRLADFAAHRVQRFEMMLLEGGWLRIKRDPEGCILVRYRVGQVSTGAALEGEVLLKGKAANVFCGELSGLLRPA
jgi:hypothetical protein